MKTLGVSLALLASAQLVLFAGANPAFADDGSKKPDVKPAAAAEESKPEPKPSDGMVEVTIDSPVGVSLEGRPGDGTPWEFVCESPCNQKVSPASQYRIVGTNLNDSKPFNLDAPRGKGDKVTLQIAPANHKKGVQGLWVLGGAGLLAVTGVIVILAGSDSKTTFSEDGATNNGNTNFIFAGTGLILAGVCGAVIGGSWYLDNRHTTVDGSPTTPEKTPGKLEISAALAPTARLPIYNAPKVASGAPTVTSFPLLRGSF